ncbi:hypothetical protein PVAP13_8KG153902 [Panicum virgatum]|uniref:Uncharacterized protein n=1 Tax=Panicum virgatum TaxID=38727 RepID=A0A8T0PGA5_PANVG|nr:hypothetical protein PVAP13_8KG153902 [Panicum virgatum]
MPIPYAPHSISFHRYSSWGRDDPWAHSPSYFRPYYVGYAAPRESSCGGKPCVENDRLKPKDQSRVQNKKRVVKQPINVLKTSAIDGNEKKNSAIDILKIKSGQRELRLEVKRRSPLSETEGKSIHPLGTSNMQKRKLQKLSAQERKDKNMAWKERKSKRQFSNMRFARNHQNYWSVHHHPFDSQMPYTPMSWNSSLDMPYGSLYHGGLLQNCYA